MRGFPGQIGLGFGRYEPVIECDNTVESALYEIMANNVSIIALAGDRIFPNVIPADALMPAIIYQQLSGPHEYDMDGPTGDELSRYQVTCWAENYEQAKELAAVVSEVLDNFSGEVSDINIEWIDVSNEGDTPQVSDKITRYGVYLDLTVRTNGN